MLLGNIIENHFDNGNDIVWYELNLSIKLAKSLLFKTNHITMRY